MVNDPVADFIIQLKNAGMAGKEVVAVPYSKHKHAIADKLAESGYLTAVEKKGKKTKKALEVTLKYRDNRTSAITDVRRISKPGRRVYQGVEEIKPVRQGFGMLVLSTPSGVLSDTEARERNVGGEALFSIW
jgi:small subunit ribosomal protein S8